VCVCVCVRARVRVRVYDVYMMRATRGRAIRIVRARC